MLVERASCYGTGILLWHGHLAVELASCQFQYIFGRAGCPLYSYSFGDSVTPNFFPLASCLLPLASCLLPTPYSLLPVPYSLFPIPYSLFPFLDPITKYCLNPKQNQGEPLLQIDLSEILKFLLVSPDDNAQFVYFPDQLTNPNELHFLDTPAFLLVIS